SESIELGMLRCDLYFLTAYSACLQFRLYLPPILRDMGQSPIPLVEGLDETFNRIALSITNGNDLFGQDDNLEDVSHLDDNCDEEVINLDGVNDSHLIITESIDLNSSLLSNNNILSNEIYEENDIDHGDTNFDIDELLDNHNLEQ
ncbi:3399_t:CDS:2, partial [Entrophospora sp. SA101]